MKQILYVLLAVWMLTGCSKDKEKTPVGNIAGSVSDRTTGEPVATVSVNLSPGGLSRVTGSDGTFDFVNLEEGTYTITISKEGYLSYEEEFIVQSAKPIPAHLLIERIPAKISVNKDTLDFGSTSNFISFKIINSTYGDLDWTILQVCPWIKEIQPSNGTLGYGKTETITITINRDLLKTGRNINTLVARTSDGGTEITIIATGSIAPSVETLKATDINPNAGTATLNGAIIEKGEPAYSEKGFVYGTTKNPTFNNNKVVVQGNNSGEFSTKISNLSTNEDTYYFRAYATNQTGITYGKNMEIPMQYVTIKAASLAVQRSDLGKTNWSSAISMCKNSTVAGFSDWRLPTYDELMTLYTNRKNIGEFSERKNDSFYWSSLCTYVEELQSMYVHLIHFADGIYYWTPQIDAENGSELWYVRCVRTIKED